MGSWLQQIKSFLRVTYITILSSGLRVFWRLTFSVRFFAHRSKCCDSKAQPEAYKQGQKKSKIAQNMQLPENA
jgi:hypothetical protein